MCHIKLSCTLSDERINRAPPASGLPFIDREKDLERWGRIKGWWGAVMVLHLISSRCLASSKPIT